MIVRRLNDLLLFGLVALSLWAYPRLPERFPVHFDMRGNPDRWSDENLWSWMLLPVLAVLLTLGMRWTQSLVRRHPLLLNVPGRERLLDVDEEVRETVFEEVDGFIERTTLLTTGLFCAVQWGIWTSSRTGASPGAMLWIVGAYTLWVLVDAVRFTARVGRLLDREERRRRAQGGPPG